MRLQWCSVMLVIMGHFTSRAAVERQRCKLDVQCGDTSCCELSSTNGIRKVCRPRPKLGDVCKVKMFPGRTGRCRCRVGLTCALTSIDQWGKNETYRCVLVPKYEEEKMEWKQ